MSPLVMFIVELTDNVRRTSGNGGASGESGLTYNKARALWSKDSMFKKHSEFAKAMVSKMEGNRGRVQRDWSTNRDTSKRLKSLTSKERIATVPKESNGGKKDTSAEIVSNLTIKYGTYSRKCWYENCLGKATYGRYHNKFGDLPIARCDTDYTRTVWINGELQQKKIRRILNRENRLTCCGVTKRNAVDLGPIFGLRESINLLRCY